MLAGSEPQSSARYLMSGAYSNQFVAVGLSGENHRTSFEALAVSRTISASNSRRAWFSKALVASDESAPSSTAAMAAATSRFDLGQLRS